MSVNPNVQVRMLLTTVLGKSNQSEANPLTPKEWAEFGVWLKKQELQPSSLLKTEWWDLVSKWQHKKITVPRLEKLLGRGVALGLALEKWERAGLWVLSYEDSDYPQILKKLLGAKAPPILFGHGCNRALLNSGGVAVVGSRSASREELDFAKDFGSKAAQDGLTVISGGARGVDENAMLGALQNGGTVIGVVANDLLRIGTTIKYREHLLTGNLILISTFNPEAGFNIGNAMARNQYLYCLADCAVVVTSTADKGGTWAGATQNIKKNWVKLWLKQGASTGNGNVELAKKGGRWIPVGVPNSLIQALELQPKTSPAITNEKEVKRNLPESDSSDEVSSKLPSNANSAKLEKQSVASDVPNNGGFYEYFLDRMRDYTIEQPRSREEIIKEFNIKPGQFKEWLDRGIAENSIERFTRPVKFQLICIDRKGQQTIKFN